MMSPNNIQDEPAGLEVAPVSDLPYVVEGPTIIEKPHHGTQYVYDQQIPGFQGMAQQNAYSNGLYSSQGYPIHSQGQPHWGGSQDGTYLTDRTLPIASSSKRICGLRVKTFWLIVGPLIAIIIIGLAVGLGVGLATSHNSSSNSDATPTSSHPSSTTGSASIACPQSNGTTYEGAGNDPFLVLCNVDYNGNWEGSGTTDIGNEETSSVEDCIDMCAGNSTCAGAGWGNYNGHYVCWMKGKLGSPQESPNWFFVIRQ
ncbi:hypothetical protein F4813DRAFT_377466 [Daldinia decipiens]|uniref:uncharacterized protein n=1 Tax=Daldinia decipiens TaxID=326647 RepID=UPI0020C2E383|nr:uncharacterized protein F4813DRAFT_377466 [Daldinia decipiens]KAI1652636.1 hypothetical protein F4813DRAFT_377466 [Daldinia decipiens]